MEEGERLWSLIICDHQMEQVDMPGLLSNWKFLSCFASQETIRQRETSSHKLGDLVLVCSLGSFHLPQECQGPNRINMGHNTWVHESNVKNLSI
jgi:hypothetical protein